MLPLVLATIGGAVAGFVAHGTDTIGLVLLAAAILLLLVVLRRMAQAPGSPAEAGPALDPLAHEMARARRFGQELSLVAVRATADVPGAPNHQAVIEAASPRQVDRAWRDGETTFLLLPQTDRMGGQLVVDRIESKLPAGSVRAGVANFPIDAVTGEALLEAALRDMAIEPVVAAVRVADSVG
ncbi:MAG: hypothetical protein IT341_09880 [Chloroflexi bacterium]|nr:hypothetical protein [Chloroflexota bacterium]